MKALLNAAAISLGLLVLPTTSFAADKGSADEAVAMTKKAVALIKSAGKAKAFAEISDPNNKTFHDRDLYIYVYDMKGITLAHGNNPKMVGKDLIDLKDNEGKAVIRAMIDIAGSNGKGWTEFKWPNPVSKTVELKAGYIEKVDNMIVGSGIYK